MSGRSSQTVDVRLIGGPTAVVTIGGLQLLIDPTFDPPRAYEDGGVAVVSKLSGPAVAFDVLQPIDAVLLSHDQHPDNLDVMGRAVLAQVPLVITTRDGAARLGGNAVGLAPWDHASIAGGLRVYAVPAQHGPGPDAESVSGQVTGFVLEAGHDASRGDGEDEAEIARVYVSGDNVDLDLVAQVVDRFGRIDVAVLFGGGASVPFMFDGELVTMTNDQLARAAVVLADATVVPVHAEGWSHYTQRREELLDAFRRAGVDGRLQVLVPGASVTIDV